MTNKTTTKAITIILILSLIMNTLTSLKIFNPQVLAAEELLIYINSEIGLNDGVLSEDFYLENELEEMPSVHEMTEEEKEVFDSIVEEQAELYAGEEKELYIELLTEFFDESSEHSGDFEHAQEVLEEAVEEDSYDSLDISSAGIMSLSSAKSAKVKIGTKFAGSVFNVIMGSLVNGGVGAIQAYISKKGKKEAAKIFTKSITSRLIAWGAPHLAKSAGIAVAVAFEYLDIGYQIAKQLDKRDKYPNNGWLDIY